MKEAKNIDNSYEFFNTHPVMIRILISGFLCRFRATCRCTPTVSKLSKRHVLKKWLTLLAPWMAMHICSTIWWRFKIRMGSQCSRTSSRQSSSLCLSLDPSNSPSQCSGLAQSSWKVHSWRIQQPTRPSFSRKWRLSTISRSYIDQMRYQWTGRMSGFASLESNYFHSLDSFRACKSHTT